MILYHLVELEPGVWLAGGIGDPPRTIALRHARQFTSLRQANGALQKARKLRPFRSACLRSVEAKVDHYGIAIKSRRRHSLCGCEVPCQGRFVCDGEHHKGNRSVPWCVGGSEDSLCSDCFVLKYPEPDKGKEGGTQ